MSSNPLWKYFHKGPRQNTSHFTTYCTACVKHFEDTSTEEYEERLRVADDAAQLTIIKERFDTDAKAEAQKQKEEEKDKHTEPRTVSSTKWKLADIADKHNSTPKKQKQSTLKAYNGLDMPFSTNEASAVQAQALHAIVSTKSPETLFEDVEMLKLFGMLRKEAPAVIPSAKVIGGRLLNDAVEKDSYWVFFTRSGAECLTFRTDGWKSIRKDAVNAVCANIDFKTYPIDTLEVTAANKDGDAQCKQFGEMIHRIEQCYACTIIYFVTDADGGSKKGHANLGKKRPYLILPDCWVHQFQLQLGDYFKIYPTGAQIAEDATFLIGWLNNHGKMHSSLLFFSIARISLQLKLELEKVRLENCRYAFWSGLESVVGDIEPVCYGTNINQKDSTRPDQVLLSIAGIYLHFTEHPEPELSGEMVRRIEKRWKGCDQPLFIAALILNPFEGVSAFGPNTGLSGFKANDIIVKLYRCMNDRPENTDSPEVRHEKERQLSKATLQYLSGTGPFADWRENCNKLEQLMGRDLTVVWQAYAGDIGIHELVGFAIMILKIVVNQAGCERVFSLLKILQAAQQNWMKYEKLKKVTKVASGIHAENLALGLLKEQGQRQNHKPDARENLLAVPRYSDLLEGMNDKDGTKHGHALVSTAEGWRTTMPKWVFDAQEAEREELEGELEDDELPINILPLQPSVPSMTRTSRPFSSTLAKLFVSLKVINKEAELMEALAEVEEDERPDDGGIEIDSADEYMG
ncbi:hypothetical protein BDP27DRAFT_1370138 [Rhodocollybia butyracea]|uniref:DUF659 domain-containing protein n=1 Tax=Rhodocollybia butyracea TaxID=206335 RepID=A0A9P5PEV5_9AGAR|nr:hypothetical protein BDP27DRAFT_1370138 [Rhodocollybia butyracea]